MLVLVCSKRSKLLNICCKLSSPAPVADISNHSQNSFPTGPELALGSFSTQHSQQKWVTDQSCQWNFLWRLCFIDFLHLQTRDGCVGPASPNSCLHPHDLESLTFSQENAPRLWLCDSSSGFRTMLYLHTMPTAFRAQGLLQAWTHLFENAWC